MSLNMKVTRGLLSCFIFLVVFLIIPGCCFDTDDFDYYDEGTYGCAYESRHSGCGGKDWSAWESGCFEFSMDDYREEWTPDRICNEYSGSDTSCSSTCCIYTQYRNTKLSSGGCY
jgi:hypothetical protein